MKDDDVIRLLSEQRPEASPLELDQIKQRVHTRAARTPRKVQPMRSRLAILFMLVMGMLMSGTGAVGAVSGLQNTDDASIAQYGQPGGDNDGDDNGDDDGNGNGGVGNGGGDDDGDVLGQNDDNDGTPGGTPDDDVAGADDDGGVAGESDSNDGDVAGATDTSAGQPAEQATASAPADELPFTGFAAIPVLLGGVALLGGGLALRRRQD